jgi:hypothetical protein
MKSYVLCPLSEKTIDEKVVRFNAAFTVALLVIFAFTQSVIPLLLLAADFLLRAVDLSNFSLLKMSSQGLVRCLSLKANHINAGPKIFAARLGFVMVLATITAVVFDFGTTAYALASILGLLSLLEAVFGFCLACKIYTILYRLLY